MYNEKYHKNENLECCKKLKDCVKSLILLANIAGFIMLCILVKFSSDDDLDDCETILGLSIALLSVLCSYMFLSIVFFFCAKREKTGWKVVGIIALLLWIARYVLFVILMHYIESYNEKECKNNHKREDKEVKRLKRCFRGFAIIQIIIDSLGEIDDLIPDKEEKKNKGYYY